MADKKISGLTAATTPLAGTEVLPIVQGGATVKVSVDNLTTGKAVTVGSLTDAGNLTFTGTGNRILGDFSNATVANRAAFQTSTTNANTFLTAIPNGTGTSAGLLAYNNSDPTNAAFISSQLIGTTEARINSGITGTGTYLPMTFYTGGSEAMRISTDRNLFVGLTTGGSTETGVVKAKGFNVRSGYAGSLGGNTYNIDFSGGNPQLYIDTTNLGTITVVSDYRIKKDIATQTSPALERVMQLRPVNYEFADYGSLFKADGVAREGFIAHELAEIIPSAVDGEKDAENRIQSLRLDALCSVLTKAIQEQQALITQLQADVAALKRN
tara:strand:+ start:1991 stop:2968 length:978 start_codon:yes stop_codon:yes gene_type:complete